MAAEETGGEDMNAQIRGDHLHHGLVKELTRAGCFRRATARSLGYAAFVLTGYFAAYAALLSEPGLAVRAAALLAAAFFSVQAGFLAHEAGHGALTRRRGLATLLGHVFHTFVSGFSSSYFRRNHGLHHPHCNDRGRDPDMQSGFFSMYRQSAMAKTGLGRLISRHQAVLIWMLIGLQGFTLKLDGLMFVRRNLRGTRADQLFLLLHFIVWGLPALALGAPDALLNYALMTVLIGFYTGSIFVVNHIGTRVIEPDEAISFFMQELSVTRNLGATRLQDLIFGGVNNHIEHHLFPSMPTARLRKARRITRDFCLSHGLAYREMSWLDAAREVTRHFRAMSACVPQ
jgi:fatty acid desaturase